MNLRLYDKEPGRILLERDYSDYFFSAEENKDQITEHLISIDHFYGKGFYREIYFDGVHIGFGKANLADKVLLGFESDFETIEMHFALKGTKSAVSENFGGTVSFQSNLHNIIYANGMCGDMQWETNHISSCEINLSPKYFSRFLPQNSDLFEQFRKRMEKKQSGLLSTTHFGISEQMYRIINDIMRCRRDGIFKRMFLEAKVIELLMLQLEQASGNEAFQSSVRRRDADKIHTVKEFILQNLDASYSLIDLAHMAGTNEFTLKKGFKELFGTTVFSFWNDAKMEQAKHMLTDQDLNVGEVSQLMGYKNQRHFSAAFKRKYGVAPSHLRKR
ncbi:MULTISPECIES: helix-turn-helix domain-containing protein [Chryseobacterium]|uniref:AraC-like DNA-binding protein n=1 Tax=Chryseobacterium camelliae TaxID=1265445 RepID=A0ABU0TIN2_9FLAO|nr:MULTISPECIES: AraC family transcriptional regulator [Chryseobacterium]MDT3409240.1 AraC-like DNA-binding protein [Pseudacidovorax intermedius]MDQ1096898.1 AraC-like DNA-binding protein [Chryseobacterium camelliae]MDQ1100840.1 AraC-like DNA-binding protein [Chryseobacterium sp. SORGH_AS_1048]MDR6084282.1 AraC-like DNA-binding protein [Chryseobacterium sp. SORGH_AS_0909]MDR6132553.1 AraC-like DNA-binding protein [Chryseobacterium sp. SORGH_AS_1175]